MKAGDAGTGDTLPRAKIERSRRAWLLWFIPLGAAGLCVWFLFRDFIATGPLVTIYFHNAEGLEEGNTPINYRGAQAAQVKSVSLAKSNEYVRVTARFTAAAKDLARAGSAFWVVRPEVRIGGVSGLRTLISGEYIAVQPGAGPRTNVFFALDKEPLPEQTNALRLTLLAADLSSLREESPIFYRGIQVGEVLHFQLGPDAREVVVRARIHEEYAPLVRLNSKFWNAGGLSFKFSLFHGAEISAESPETLLTGGIEFATPPEPGAAATNGASFRLYEKPEDAWKAWAPAIPLHLPEQAPLAVTPAELRSK
jgi:paraquat-inducible protein B